MWSSDFFVLRTPLLPFEELESWQVGLETPNSEGEDGDEQALQQAIARDRRVLRERLRELLDRPEIREALFVASPSLTRAIEAWERKPDSKKGRRAERTLVRYLTRMSTRATPFGLFAGASMSGDDAWGEEARVELSPRASYRRYTRLDMDYLFNLTEELRQDRRVQESFKLYPNSSLRLDVDKVHYAEARLDGRLRSYHLVAVGRSRFLDAAIDRAHRGATLREIGAAVAHADPDGEISLEEGEDFVSELVGHQILVSELVPAITGQDATAELAEVLTAEPMTRAFGATLEDVRRGLERLDRSGIGNSQARYEAVSRHLDGSLPTDANPSRLVQVDMAKPIDGLALPKVVRDDLERTVALLHRIVRPQPDESGMDRFRREFVERYGERQSLPLLEVLDEERGIGFERAENVFAEAAPLLGRLAIGSPGDSQIAWTSRDTYLMERVQALEREGERERERVLELTDDDIEALETEAPKPLPDAFHVVAEIAASSVESLNEGAFRILFKGASGPSGARLLGRFCHLDARLEEATRRHLRAEEALRPDAIFAEIVHLPQGRAGNILSRPRLRRHEIEFLGRGSVDREARIDPADLRVSVVGDRVVLTSERLGREVIPRMTTAHNYSLRSLGLYRFLCALQSDGLTGNLSWLWGPVAASLSLPRVTTGRVVLARARWRFGRGEAADLGGREGTDAIQKLRAWRARRGIPQRCFLQEQDHELLVDFEDILSAESFCERIKGGTEGGLVEFFPGEDDLWVSGPEGRFVHELVVPFVRSGDQGRERGRREIGRQRASVAVAETFPPGSEWLYAKLYTGKSTSDVVLREAIGPVVLEARSRNLADGWFFLRYSDPEWHLRVRFHGEPSTLQRSLLPLLCDRLSAFLEDGRVWRMQLDTYQRETERYGGPTGIPIAERLFEADSDAVLAVTHLLEGDEGADARWRLTLRGVDQLLDDLGLDLETKIRIAERLREGYSREFRASLDLKRQIGNRFREERDQLLSLLERSNDGRSALAPALDVFHRRSKAVASEVAALSRLERAGQLTRPMEDVATSLIHMHVNRMTRAHARAHELVMYDFLYRLYRSLEARKGRLSKTA